MVRRRVRGVRWTVFEVLIATAIVVAVAGITVPRTDGSPESVETRSVLRLVQRLEQACLRHIADTGLPARDGVDAAAQGLSHATGVAGWNGPYLTPPLTAGDQPFAGALVIADRLGHEDLDGGFRLEGLGKALVAGPGNVLVLTEVPTAVAMLVDRALDAKIAGDWMRVGRVEFDPGEETGRLRICLAVVPVH